MKIIYFNKKIYEFKSLDLGKSFLYELSSRGLTVCDLCDLNYKCTGNYNICGILNKNLGPSDLIPMDSIIKEIHLFELIKKFML